LHSRCRITYRHIRSIISGTTTNLNEVKNEITLCLLHFIVCISGECLKKMGRKFSSSWNKRHFNCCECKDIISITIHCKLTFSLFLGGFYSHFLRYLFIEMVLVYFSFLGEMIHRYRWKSFGFTQNEEKKIEAIIGCCLCLQILVYLAFLSSLGSELTCHVPMVWMRY
jgi:hypothetical protein